MPSRDSITILHVSDMQFGRNHRFGNLAAGDPDAELDTLFTRLDDDLKLLAKTPGVRPELVVVSGDLAEWGLASEFDDAFAFLDRIGPASTWHAAGSWSSPAITTSTASAIRGRALQDPC